MTNNPKDTKKAPQMAISYKCEDCGAKVENGVPKYKESKLLCERCFYAKKNSIRTGGRKKILYNYYLKWAGVSR